VRYVRNDLMGIVREDLIYDVGRHVDDSVHNFRGMGPADLETGRRRGQEAHRGRQAGALGQMADHDQWRILQMDRRRGREKSARHAERPGTRVIVRMVTDKNDPTRVAGAAGFSVRDHKLYVYKFKCCLLACGAP